jgi:hypothetical protein
MPDENPAVAEHDTGSTRRGMLRGAAGLGAGLAAGVLMAASAGTASASTASADTAQAGEGAAPRHDEPIVAHVHDARTGVVDLYTGTRHIRFTDPRLAASLARAAR